ncbi:MAG TPA: type II toxin-antitoxin system death-on-curing family toxin [Solirubrobacteraceae bacterium]|jgi:death-on-curing protein|nr:type II toxin-antitoxin system death-on-curing family toxin [Solirubrobacteraceae bacterium]
MVEGQSGEFAPVYLTLADVLELHALIIGATAAEAADQLRNRAGLESAIARPETYAHYQDADLALQAAVLAHGIAEGQYFIDGNKRTALIAMLVFLEINGSRIEASDPELADWILGFSSGATPEAVAALVASSMRSIG